MHNKSVLQEYLNPSTARTNVVLEEGQDAFGNKAKNKTVAFLYKWTNTVNNMWYVGSRTAKGCHPDDGYICSSRSVKPLITESPEQWVRHILVIGEPTYIRELENSYLTSVDAKNNPNSYNMHNGDGKFSTLGRKEPKHLTEQRAAKTRGTKKPEGFGDKIRQARTGLEFSEEWKKNIGKASKGRVQSVEARKKNSVSNSGENNGMYGRNHTEESKIKASITKTGSITKAWQGWWIAPSGEKFTTLTMAHRKFPVASTNTIRIWCRENKNGWSFQSKDDV